MNLIINGFHQKESFPIILELLERFNVKTCHLIHAESKIEIPASTAAVFYDVKKIESGDYNVAWEKITPVDAELLKKMNNCEVEIFKMMDRLPDRLSYDERKRLYLKHLRFWNHLLENNNIDLFLSSSPPHEIYDFVIYHLCKLKKIPTIMFYQARVFDTITMFENLEDNVYKIKEKYLELLEKYQSTDESEIPLSGRFKKDFEMNTVREDPKRFEMLRKKNPVDPFNNLLFKLKLVNLNRVALFIKQGILIKKLVNYLNKIITEDRVLKFYKNNVVVPNLTEKYIYFPLHMQPECSTSPMAGVYVDQLLIAQMIAYYLPENIYIYIKENPFQTIVGRNKEFYQDLLKIPQVRFVSDSFSSYSLINNSMAVATATGTAGWEALYQSKPVLMFGYNFYQYAKGVFQIKTNLDCQKALTKIFSEKYRPNLKDLKIYLKALEETTIEGYVDLDYKKDTNVTDSISNKNILDSLSKTINSIFN